MNSHICGRLTFNKGAKIIQWEKEQSSQSTQTRHTTCKRMKGIPALCVTQKSNTKIKRPKYES